MATPIPHAQTSTDRRPSDQLKIQSILNPTTSNEDHNNDMYSRKSLPSPVFLRTRQHTGIPVTFHIESRKAAEKRKRNTEASLRYRQRIKEAIAQEAIEQEVIKQLEDELRVMTEDCKYYKLERDRYLEALKETPSWERHLPCSPSSYAKRVRQSSHTSLNSSGGVSDKPIIPPSTEVHQQLVNIK